MVGISLNEKAFKIVKEMMDRAEEINANIVKLKNRATIITADGFEAGKYLLEIRYGGLAQVRIDWAEVEDLQLPSLHISTDHPALSILGSFIGYWRFPEFPGLLGKGSAIGGGPARALALNPPEAYNLLGYKDEADVAVLTVQIDKMPLEKFPGEKMAKIVASKCGVNPENVYLLLSLNQSLAGTIQIAGCVLELGLFIPWHVYRYDVRKFKYACGVIPIMPVHPDAYKAMGLANDAVMYGSRAIFYVETDEGENVEDLAKKITLEKTWPGYGKIYEEALEEAGYDFYALPGDQINALSDVTINDLRTGRVCKMGKVRFDLLKKAMKPLLSR